VANKIIIDTIVAINDSLEIFLNLKNKKAIKNRIVAKISQFVNVCPKIARGLKRGLVIITAGLKDPCFIPAIPKSRRSGISCPIKKTRP